MGIGLGVTLIIAGLLLVAGVFNFDINYVDDNALGWILLFGGILSLVLGFAMSRRARTVVSPRDRVVEERVERY